MFKGHDLPRLRGVMHGPRTNEENVRVLAEEWGANHLRWQINWTPMREAEEWARDLDAYDEWLDGILPEVDKAQMWWRYKGRHHIWAYDLLNEPVEPPPGPGVVTWSELFTRVTKAIREMDPGKPVLFEPGLGIEITRDHLRPLGIHHP